MNLNSSLLMPPSQIEHKDRLKLNICKGRFVLIRMMS